MLLKSQLTNSLGMTAIRRKWPLFLLLATWLSMVPALSYVPDDEAVEHWIAAWTGIGREGQPAKAFMNEAQRAKFDQDVQTITNRDVVRRHLWKSWALNAVAVLLGLSSAVVAILHIKGWRLALIAASLSYLVFIAHFPVVSALELDRWLGWWLALTTYPGWGTWMIYHDVALPLMHTLLVCIFGVRLLTDFRSHGTTTPSQ